MIAAWAGPWPVTERWWSVRRRRARVQVVTADGAARLLCTERGQWWVEAFYDWSRRTPSSTHTPASAFSTAAVTPKSWRPRLPGFGLAALALTDHHGFYGVVRFAGGGVGLRPADSLYGTEVTLAPAGPRTGEPDPSGTHLIVLARDPEGYASLSTVLADAHLEGGEKGRPIFTLDALAAAANGHWLVLTGCRKGAVPATLMEAGPRAASRELARRFLIEGFGSARSVASRVVGPR